MVKDIVGSLLIVVWLGIWALGFIYIGKVVSRRRRGL